MKQNIKTIVGISLGAVLIASTVVLIFVSIPPHPELTEHVNIIIWGDEDFENYNFEGEGTKENPYIIQYLNITTEKNYGIFIRDTTAHFQIRNCYVEANTTGIHITKAASGSFELIENTCFRNWWGIVVVSTDNFSLLGNNCSLSFIVDRPLIIHQDTVGITLRHCYNAKLIDNACNGNSHYGILLSDSDATTLINNTCKGNYLGGISAVISPNSIFINNTCSNNIFQKGTSIYNATFDSHGIQISGSENSTIINNTCSNNSNYGISLWQSANSELENNLCENNSEYGIYTLNSNNTKISNNKCIKNNFGIILSGSDDCDLTYNLLEENEEYGIGLFNQSDNNVIHHNSFRENNLAGLSQAYDEDIGNMWYDDVALEGNFWSDYVGISDNYTIAGPANSVDLYPLIEDPLMLMIHVRYSSLMNEIRISDYH